MLFTATLGALALCSAVSALPAVDDAPKPTPVIVKRVDQNLPWVTIDSLGQPSTTFTPTITTISGSTSVVNPAPYELTGTVYTTTDWGIISTSTGEPPNPKATGAHGEGVFQKCENKDPATQPFCRPFVNSTLIVGNTYLVTWDVSYYNQSFLAGNSTMDVKILLHYLNTTSNKMVILKDDYEAYPAKWGFARLPIDKSLLSNNSGQNITITLRNGTTGVEGRNSTIALPMIFAERGFPEKANEKLPKGAALYIGIPIAFAAVLLLVCGGYMWNRKTRRIQLGDIMSRSRKGYSGRSERRDRAFSGRNNNEGGAIQMDPHHDPFDANVYRDAPEHPRHENDGPVEGSFQQQGTSGGRNAFRDEVDRQNSERRNMDRY